MAAAFIGLVLVDGWMDGSWTAAKDDDKPFQGPIFAALVCVLMVPAHLELAAMARAKGLRIPTAATIAGSVLLCTTPCWPACRGLGWGEYMALVLSGTLCALLLYHVLTNGLAGAMASTGIGLLAVVYLGLLGGLAVAVRVDFGVWPLLMYVWVVKAADIGAFAVGSLVGRHKLAPRISPGKTWEGLAGALAVATGASAAFAALAGPHLVGMTFLHSIILGLLLGGAAVVGDLIESMFKREAAVKDSGRLLPGMGGMLDLLDSLLFNAPLMYLYLRHILTHQ